MQVIITWKLFTPHDRQSTQNMESIKDRAYQSRHDNSNQTHIIFLSVYPYSTFPFNLGMNIGPRVIKPGAKTLGARFSIYTKEYNIQIYLIGKQATLGAEAAYLVFDDEVAGTRHEYNQTRVKNKRGD